MTISPNIIGVILFALLIVLAFAGWSGRHRVKFRYIVLAFAVLVVLLSVVWK